MINPLLSRLSSLPRPNLFPAFLSLSLSLSLCVSLSPWFPLALRCSHESTASSAPWMWVLLRKSSVSHSLGKGWRGTLCSLPRGRHPALRLLDSQVWLGDPGEAEDPSSWANQERVARGVPADWGPLGASESFSCLPLASLQKLLCRMIWERGRARSGFKSWICPLALWGGGQLAPPEPRVPPRWKETANSAKLMSGFKEKAERA